MILKKVNVIESLWVDSNYYSTIRPKLSEANIPILRQTVLSLTRLYDDVFWKELQNDHKIDIAVPDYRHWYYDDDVFDLYVKHIASVHFPVFCMFECPFGFEYPSKISGTVFSNKLFERTKKLASAIKKNFSDTIILSPAIGIIEEKFRSLYLDYFVHNRQYFDGYAVHVCNDMTDYSLGKVSSLLTQVMKVLSKKLYVTKWALPVFDGDIINIKSMEPLNWKPHQTTEAETRLTRSLSLIDSIASVGSHWFYVGLGRDLYHPRQSSSEQVFWNQSKLPLIPDHWHDYWNEWRFWHFLGMSESDGKLKEQFLSTFIKFAQKQNA